jgi:N-acetylglucosaminyldiphosphoundecaprenol N-acetyl-beta-D-mannosaminyltransferase
MARWLYEPSKRAIDLLVAVALLAIVAPLATVALATARRGLLPRLAATRCVGRAGRRFERLREVLTDEGSRLAWLADWPVLLAVIAGHASLVGPRIVSAEEAAALDAADRDRFAVRPGLLCYWWLQQRANIDFDREAEADRRYLRERSLRTDLSILLRSALAMPYGRGDGRHGAAVHIAGIRLLNLGMDELVAAIEAALQGRSSTQVAFVNPACVNIAAVDPRYRAALAHADWVCPDGIGMKIAGQILGRPIRQNLNGTDLFPRLCESLAASGQRLYLLGARPGVAEATAQWAQQRFPRLRIAGTRSGYFDARDEEAVIAGIRRSGADVLLVAMGVPAQDLWLRRNLKKTGARVGIGVGGLFDFYGGRIPRAPLWLREIGGEWVYRLIQEPRRMWRRYLVGNFTFLYRIARERVSPAASTGSQRWMH